MLKVFEVKKIYHTSVSYTKLTVILGICKIYIEFLENKHFKENYLPRRVQM